MLSVLIAAALGVIVGYSFRGKEVKALKALAADAQAELAKLKAKV